MKKEVKRLKKLDKQAFKIILLLYKAEPGNQKRRELLAQYYNAHLVIMNSDELICKKTYDNLFVYSIMGNVIKDIENVLYYANNIQNYYAEVLAKMLKEMLSIMQKIQTIKLNVITEA
ncbi:MAG: hypothetical protein QXL51_03960 [Candidatus Aenigmatarchaeota archaeon]